MKRWPSLSQIAIFRPAVFHFINLTLAISLISCQFAKIPDIRGIDVSHHQGRIDWEAVSKQNVRFAYVKCTEGKTWSDSLYSFNLGEARKNKIPVGSYHYFSFCLSGAEQARNFLAKLDFKKGDLIPVVDVESGGDCGGMPEKEWIERELGVFIDSVKSGLDVDPIIYTTQWFYWRHFPDAFESSRFWVRNVLWRPPQKENWILWQYEISPLRGVEGGVDKNGFTGSEEEFSKLIWK